MDFSCLFIITHNSLLSICKPINCFINQSFKLSSVQPFVSIFVTSLPPSFHHPDHHSQLPVCVFVHLVYFPARWPPDVLRGSLFFFAGGDGHQLFGSFGDVISTLDDLLGEELVVHRAYRGV